jgi:hypothetical protein
LDCSGGYRFCTSVAGVGFCLSVWWYRVGPIV